MTTEQFCDIIAVSTASSPITHMASTHGNEHVVNRETVVTDDGLRHVPVLSGNALRHKLVRRPAARNLIEQWQLKGLLTLDQLNFLFHGGALTEKGGRIKLAQQSELYRLFPALKLLGCSLPGQIVPGVLQCRRGVLVCRENRERLASLLPHVEWPRRLRSAVSFIAPYTYYRHDASKTAADLVAPNGDAEADHSGMIFAGQSIISGAVFVHGFTITHGEPLEIGALLDCLWRWRLAGGTIGGQAAKGHGRLETRFVLPEGIDAGELIAAYNAHVAAVKDEATAFLTAIFAGETPDHGEPAKKRGRKKKAKVSS